MKIKYCLLLSSILVGCSVSEGNLVGKYVYKKRGDTLIVLANHTFEYTVRMNNGEDGWNNGSWAVNGQALSFFDTKPKPIVGCKLKKIVIGKTDDAIQLIFKLTIPHKKINIDSVLVFDNGNRIDSRC